MLNAPKLEDVLAHSNKHDSAACCILLAPLFSKVAKDEVIPRIVYLNYRSGKYVHFYCAGYGAYGQSSIIPDMKELGEVTYDDGTVIPWFFSQLLFGKFVDQLEAATTWTYSGNTEIIFLNPDVDFSNTLVLDVDAMIRDGGIGDSAELFEDIIRYCRNSAGDPSAYDFSDLKGAKEVVKGSVDSLLEVLPKPVQGIWRKGRHYAVRNIAA